MPMIKFHAVMIGECNEEFGVDIEAESRDAAYEQLEEDYPESRVDVLEDGQQSREREERTYEYAARCLDDPYYEIDTWGRW